VRPWLRQCLADDMRSNDLAYSYTGTLHWSSVLLKLFPVNPTCGPYPRLAFLRLPGRLFVSMTCMWEILAFVVATIRPRCYGKPSTAVNTTDVVVLYGPARIKLMLTSGIVHSLGLGDFTGTTIWLTEANSKCRFLPKQNHTLKQ